MAGFFQGVGTSCRICSNNVFIACDTVEDCAVCNGGANDGDAWSATTATFSITVDPVNDAPTATAGSTGTIDISGSHSPYSRDQEDAAFGGGPPKALPWPK